MIDLDGAMHVQSEIFVTMKLVKAGAEELEPYEARPRSL